jgi:hypothetical protein
VGGPADGVDVQQVPAPGDSEQDCQLREVGVLGCHLQQAGVWRSGWFPGETV